MKSAKVLYIARRGDIRMRHEALHNIPRVLFVLQNTNLRCSSNDKWLSSIIPRCFCDVAWWTILLLKVKGDESPYQLSYSK